ncbi:MAG: hypothetical protein GC162_15640 [Planctomycetes bacterium]|nr:hypothetical protein [Planctomycetota bacterium]
MKVELLTDGSPDCPLVRLYDFTPAEAEALRAGVRRLADGQCKQLDLAADCDASPMGGFALSFVVGRRDVGLTSEGRRHFWELRSETWDNLEGLLGPFVNGLTGYQWLSNEGGTALLISTNGHW